jgi:hypothetical protein
MAGATVTIAWLCAQYAPWLPTLAFQLLHTGAPWADRPTPLRGCAPCGSARAAGATQQRPRGAVRGEYPPVI